MEKRKILMAVLGLLAVLTAGAQGFRLTDGGYFNSGGVDVMAFSDFYPEGHQGGISVLMNGQRLATNGDLRMEATPGQWQPVPRQLSREVADGRITTTLCYPDSARHRQGFNPMVYPDYHVKYTVTLESRGDALLVSVNLDTPVPAALQGKVGFNLEFFPGILFGRPWLMDDRGGFFPRQPNGPLEQHGQNLQHAWDYQPDALPFDLNQELGLGYSPLAADDIIGAPYAEGHTFTVAPDDPLLRLTVESLTGNLKLYDGRMNHNNGWFVLRQEIAPGATEGAVQWLLRPSVDPDWRRLPVLQTSQVGYHPQQPKRVIIETDPRSTTLPPLRLLKLDSQGEQLVHTLEAKAWGRFLRYQYLTADFSDVTDEGLYIIRCGEQASPVFRIARDVYDRGVWQPVLEYFLPVQMCHQRVSEKYRVWHDACHLDDARMAPAGNHIDGYAQQPGLSPFKPGERVPGVNRGGWHDAGDFDLRVESQAGEAYILALTHEAFRPELDVTAIDFDRHTTEIHQPDGRNDLLQQVENGALTVVSSYRALGRLYRGIICNNVRQYVLLGDAAAMTNGQPDEDDRWIFTEDNPARAISTAAQLAAAGRVLRGFNDTLSAQCLDIAQRIYATTQLPEQLKPMRLQAAAELFLATRQPDYLDFILSQQEAVTAHIGRMGWFLARITRDLEQQLSASGAARSRADRRAEPFCKAFRAALVKYRSELQQLSVETPYGVPYRPNIWGAGWDIQRFGFQYYFLCEAYPDLFTPQPVFDALNFILGCHPGSNQASFVSGVGAQSATTAYGLNRADWSYIPGGVVSGTALIRPDFPELLEFPFLWQQTEYVLGGGSSHYMFLVLAAKSLLK